MEHLAHTPTKLTPVYVTATFFPNGRKAHDDEFYADWETVKARAQELRDQGFTVLQCGDGKQLTGYCGFRRPDPTGTFSNGEQFLTVEVAELALYDCGCPKVPPGN